MASFNQKKLCVKCPKSPGQVLCDGCQEYFCVKHLLEHRQDLNQQMDLTQEHDQLQQALIDKTDDYEHPLTLRINQWESKCIERIKKVADQARLELKKSLVQIKEKIQEPLCELTKELKESQRTEIYTELDLKRWLERLKHLRDQWDTPLIISKDHDEDIESTVHLPLIQLRPLNRKKIISHISDKMTWVKAAKTVAAGHGKGDALNQLDLPFGLDIDDDGTLFIADTGNHRVLRWKPYMTKGEIFAGGNGTGDRTDQLNQPVAVVIDRINDCLIISDSGNRRVMRWPLDQQEQNSIKGEVIITNLQSYGLAIDDDGSLYVSDYDKHEVRRYRCDDGKDGVVVAGGFGQGDALNQLNCPRQIFVDDDYSVYVSDKQNHRVVKWGKNTRKGIVVAGGWDKGDGLNQLFRPGGIFVDQTGCLYICDQGNDRVMRWQKGANQGEVLLGGQSQATEKNQLNRPASLSLDYNRHIYIVDRNNHRIERLDAV